MKGKLEVPEQTKRACCAPWWNDRLAAADKLVAQVIKHSLIPTDDQLIILHQTYLRKT